MEEMGYGGKNFLQGTQDCAGWREKPRFRVVAVLDCNLKVYSDHLRLSELTHLAEEAGAELIHLKKGPKQDTPDKR